MLRPVNDAYCPGGVVVSGEVVVPPWSVGGVVVSGDPGVVVASGLVVPGDVVSGGMVVSGEVVSGLVPGSVVVVSSPGEVGAVDSWRAQAAASSRMPKLVNSTLRFI
jgi:hypothetical protein